MPDANYFENEKDHPWAPARKCFVITPHDVNAISPIPTRGIRASADGTITLRAIGSSVDVPHPVVAGEYVPVAAQYIRDTGTDVDVIGYA
jgi:hypothetical protein